MRGSLPLLLLAGLLAGCDSVKLEDTGTDWEDLLLERYIVRLDAEPAEVLETVNEIAVAFDLEPIHIFQQVTQGFEVELPPGLPESIEELDEVEYIVIDPEDELVPAPDEGSPDFPPDTIPSGVARIGGPAPFDCSGIGVAVVDTGVDLDHPELNVVDAVDIVAEGGGEDSGGDDLNGHGTHVAGIIGARGEKVVGVCPGASIYAVRVLDSSGSGSYGDVIAGLEWVAEHPEIKVVNLSLGGPGSTAPPAPLEEAIENLRDSGVVVAIAAGNDGADTAGYIPAGYDQGLVVSAYDADRGDNGFPSWSNYGDEVDVAAPGVEITSTWPGGDYASLSGTSMATPHVAGAAAAYLVEHPSAGAQAVETAVVTNGEEGYAGQGGQHPEPLLDLAALLDEG